MTWKELSSIHQLDEIVVQSQVAPVVLFKHSTRCAISHMVKSRLDRSEGIAGIDFYYLDLLQHRNISNEIAVRFEVHHESPQIIIIAQGRCVYDESHNAIDMQSIDEQIKML